MRLSAYFLPLLKENPADAQVVSHRLMLRAGMISQQSSGIYTWLPMGVRVLQNIEKIIAEEQDAIGAQRIIMPTIQSADLWRESGRYDAYGQEMLRMKDRHDRDLLYTPTAEEVVADLARRYLKSYRDLPTMCYQIHWKFRDEIRPRFGVLRGREFLMKDAYSLDASEEEARGSYERMLRAYVRTFQRLGLVAIPVRAPTGAIGGNLSHEFQVLTQTGESLIYYQKELKPIITGERPLDFEELLSLYAMEEELHDPENCPVKGQDLCTERGIEVGHIFYFGTKYTQALGAKIMDSQGNPMLPHMGSYGIGVSRLVAALIEAHHDEDGIRWPESVAPFTLSLLNLKVGDEACDDLCEEIYRTFQARGVSVLYDDRNERAGMKFATHDLIGSPWQMRVGPRGAKSETVEVKQRQTGTVHEVHYASAVAQLMAHLGFK